MGRKKKIENIIKEMVEEYGFDESKFSDLPEVEIRAMYEEVTSQNFADNAIQDLDDIEEENTGGEEEVNINNKIVQKNIMDLFTDEEKGRVEDSGDEYVKIEGLRRVFSEQKGEIVEQSIRPMNISVGENHGISIIMSIAYRDNDSGELVTLSDGADGIPFYNIDREYGKYPTAIAITRAEGRIYRKALNIKAVCFEEVANDVPEFFSTNTSNGKIENIQISIIKSLCNKKGLDIDAAIMEAGREAKKESGFDVSIENLKKEDATTVIAYLNNYKEK